MKVDAIQNHRRRVIATNGKLRAVVEELEGTLEDLEEDWELTPEQRRAGGRHACEQAERRFQMIRREYADSLEAGDQLARELRVARKVDPEAQVRVRELLDRGLTPVSIASKARELRDGEAAAALRKELLYFGVGDKFADASQAIRAAEDVLVELDDTDAPSIRAIRDMERAAESVPSVEKFVVRKLAAGGRTTAQTARARTELAFAAGAVSD